MSDRNQPVAPDYETKLLPEPRSLTFRRPFTERDETTTVTLYNVADRSVVYHYQVSSAAALTYKVERACGVLPSKSCLKTIVTRKKCAERNEPDASYDRDTFRLAYTVIDDSDVKTAPSEVWSRFRNAKMHHVEIPAFLENDQSSAGSTAFSRSGREPSRTTSADTIQRALSPEPYRHDMWFDVSSAPALGPTNIARRFRYKRMSSQLGIGGFAYVSEGVLQLKDGTELDVAVKRLNPRNLLGKEPDMDVFVKLQKRLILEINAWQGLGHKNVAPLLAFITHDQFCLLTHWYHHGDIARYVIQTSASNEHRRQLLRETAEGLQYLHRQDVVHGDMKSDNVVVTNEGHAIIIDFGLSVAFASEISDAELRDKRSTPLPCHRWMAPELIQKKVDDKLIVGRAKRPSDVFSFACVALEIAADAEPFKDLHVYEVVPLLQKGETSKASDYPTLAGEGSRFWELLLDCWKQEPEARPNMDEVLERIESLTEPDVWKS